MVQVAVHQIIDVIAVRNRLVTTTGAMLMISGVSAALMAWRANRGVRSRHLDRVFAYGPVGGLVMQMTVVQIVDVPFVLNRGVTAIGSVLMIMMGVERTHGSLL